MSNAHLEFALIAARESSDRLSAAPAPRVLVHTPESIQKAVLRKSLSDQERAAWLYAALMRASVEDDTEALKMLEDAGSRKGFLGATVFATETLKRVAEDGDMDLVSIVYQQHFHVDGSVRQSEQ